MTMPPDELARRASEIDWFHSMDLGGGVVTRGHKTQALLKEEADLVFRRPLNGLSVLDIGAWDGWFSFEAKRRGAARVVAIDHWVWTSRRTKDRGFCLAREALGLDIEQRFCAVSDISRALLGTFDIVLFLGVLYHLKEPFAAIEKVGACCAPHGTLVLETHVADLDRTEPVMRFYPRDTLLGDRSNWWGPNPACVRDMLWEAGFESIEDTLRVNPTHPSRGRLIAHATGRAERWHHE